MVGNNLTIIISKHISQANMMIPSSITVLLPQCIYAFNLPVLPLCLSYRSVLLDSLINKSVVRSYNKTICVRTTEIFCINSAISSTAFVQASNTSSSYFLQHYLSGHGRYTLPVCVKISRSSIPFKPLISLYLHNGFLYIRL